MCSLNWHHPRGVSRPFSLHWSLFAQFHEEYGDPIFKALLKEVDDHQALFSSLVQSAPSQAYEFPLALIVLRSISNILQLLGGISHSDCDGNS